MPKALYILKKELFDTVYPIEVQTEIAEHVEILHPPLNNETCFEHPELLQEVELIFSGWGAPVFDEYFLELTPNLKAIFYAAGTMKSLLTDAVWKRNITVTTANIANAIPVAEFTLSQILFALKNGWELREQVRQDRTYQFGAFTFVFGNYNRNIGLISLSQVGRKVLEYLKPFDVNVLVYDPFVSDKEAVELNITKVSLEELFKESEIVSLHSPLLPETTGMITGELLETMKSHATFINTARGAIVKEEEMIAVLKERTDLTAILDVTHPEPPEADSPLYDMKNVILTPHIAGSAGTEIGRMGAYMLSELKLYLANKRLNYQITKEKYQHMA
ncbi:hydroxyacid dehydrogenase [Desemzia sp. RIT804]|uniref:hydroxyacid dehydrogenase n=1 Tax=Desemzia sp. RIT 804 TaxID=2810209 RepID=UPI0019503FE5|nr:hydroxyacid dehydrogenase [Desemzia sp. RIT 804]MBM6614738.1 hydroxyacid dehydrogenase [Desemzia sp. RIT 804]